MTIPSSKRLKQSHPPKFNPVPRDMKRVELYLPPDVNLGDMEWFELRPDAEPRLAVGLRGVLSGVSA